MRTSLFNAEGETLKVTICSQTFSDTSKYHCWKGNTIFTVDFLSKPDLRTEFAFFLFFCFFFALPPVTWLRHERDLKGVRPSVQAVGWINRPAARLKICGCCRPPAHASSRGKYCQTGWMYPPYVWTQLCNDFLFENSLNLVIWQWRKGREHVCVCGYNWNFQHPQHQTTVVWVK